MESVGPYLKQLREAKGFSLDHMASVTRIQRKILEALEEERFAQLPQPVFIRGFLRTYARALGIDEEDVLRRFAEASSQFYAQQEAEQQRTRLQREEERRGKRTRNLVLGITVGVLLGLIVLLPREHKPVPPPSSPNSPTPARADSARDHGGASDTSIEKADANSSARHPTPSSAKSPESAVASLNAIPDSQPEARENPSGASPETSRSQRLQLEAKEMTWIVVQADDGQPQEALLKPGERATWLAHERFTLTLGNAGGVTVTFNGKTLKPFGKPGVVVRNIVIPSQ